MNIKDCIAMQPKQFGIVHFDSQPHGASIIVDGQVLVNPDTEESIKTPATVELVEGRRDFILRLEGSEDVTGYVDVIAGVSVNVFRNFSPGMPGGGEKPQPQIFLAKNTGVLKIYPLPDGASAYVNGMHVGKTPLIVTDVPAGVATITFKMTGMMDEEKIVDIVEGAWSDTYATMRPVLPKLQSYYQNEVEIMNETTNMNIMQEPFYPESPEIPCAFPERPGETATQGSIVITTYPLGGTIIMDGKTIIDLDTGAPITTPVQLVMGFGFHDLRFHLDGFFDESAGVYISPAHISFIHKNFNVQ